MDINTAFTPELALASAFRTLETEAQAILALRDGLRTAFPDAVARILACKGRVIVTGLGKTGHIATKIAATFASTGTPSFFLHAAEAVHGDLGMVTGADILLAISQSGGSQELLTILPAVRRLGVPVIAISGNPQSELARNADIYLSSAVAQEACPLNLAPTASTTAALALGDALAVACLEARGFNAQDFARSHPGGALGRRLLTLVRDVMRQGDALPTVSLQASMIQALEEISRKGMGMTIVLDDTDRPCGIFTDGDLRRVLEKRGSITGLSVSEGMTRQPRAILPEALAVDAAARMDELRVSQLLVTDAQGKLVGALHMHDLMAAKVI
ncbi:KpsF/GutQ family sugar-phosphate isomerase [Kerstersia sp.]|uniref:KpsF/GutQ family sugar-phosphate isomerase n=1 Tax=Kerstersia sp. TaxID=1930783 RepID=UPI003F8F584C